LEVGITSARWRGRARLNLAGSAGFRAAQNRCAGLDDGKCCRLLALSVLAGPWGLRLYQHIAAPMSFPRGTTPGPKPGGERMATSKTPLRTAAEKGPLVVRREGWGRRPNRRRAGRLVAVWIAGGTLDLSLGRGHLFRGLRLGRMSVRNSVVCTPPTPFALCGILVRSGG